MFSKFFFNILPESTAAGIKLLDLLFFGVRSLQYFLVDLLLFFRSQGFVHWLGKACTWCGRKV